MLAIVIASSIAVNSEAAQCDTRTR
jgi:hypothetical protein